MEGEPLLRCPICGEGQEGSSSCDGRESSVLLQNFVQCLGRYFQDDINFGGEEGFTMMLPGKVCSSYLKPVVCGVEMVEEWSKHVAELERSLRRKLRELKANGDNVLSQLKLIQEAMIDRQNEGLDLNQKGIYIRKGAEKACTALTIPMAELEEKLDWFKKWASAKTGKIHTEVEGTSSAAKETCRVVSVTSIATSADDKSFEAGEVFQVKTGLKDDVDTASTGDSVPALEGVVKIEEEYVRETRQGPIYLNKKTSLPVPLGILTMVGTTENKKSVDEIMLIDLEEETRETADAGDVSTSPSPPLSQDFHLKEDGESNVADASKRSEELMHFEAEEDANPLLACPTHSISTLLSKEIILNKKQSEQSGVYHMKATPSQMLIEETEDRGYAEKEIKNNRRKRSISEVDGPLRKTDNVSEKMAHKKRRTGEPSCLQIHLKSHKAKPEKNIQCDFCPKTFDKLSYKKSHMRIHTKEKPFQCDVCKRKFSHRCSLKVHLLIHTGAKPFSCEICNASFTQSNQIKAHMRTHTGEKPFECQFCGKRFAQSGHLTRHCRTHTGEKPFSCKICKREFANDSYLRKHISTHMKHLHRIQN